MKKNIFTIQSSQKIIPLAFLIFGLISLFNIAYLFLYFKTNIGKGIIDFNVYWYAGQFVRQGINPYLGYLENIELNLPITFVDGVISTSETLISKPGLMKVLPGNTAPFVLFMTLFSFISLKLSAVIWAFIEVVAAILLPILVLQLFELNEIKVSRYLYPLSTLIFLSINTTARGAIAGGQPTLFLVMLMVLTLLLAKQKHIFLAGVIFGFALSKYHVALPFLIFLLFQKQWKIIIIAACVQLLGILTLAFITSSSPFLIPYQ